MFINSNREGLQSNQLEFYYNGSKKDGLWGKNGLDWFKWCIFTASFSILINGSLTGFFSNSRGLRWGEKELRWMSEEMHGYVEVVLNNLAANVPKVHGR